MHGKGDLCPARNKSGRKCNKMGHFEAVCKTKMPKEVMAVAPGEADSDETFFLGAVTEPDCTVIAQPDSDED